MTEPRASGPRLKIWRLVNFKSVRKAEIEFKPLTLLVGANSSGKSSVLQSILLAVQSVQSGATTGQFSLNGPLVDLGTYQDVKNSRASGNPGFGGAVELPVALPGDEASGTAWPIASSSATWRVGASSHGSLPRAFPAVSESQSRAIVTWDVGLERAGGQASGSARVRSVDVDVEPGGGNQESRYRLSLKKSSGAEVSATFWRAPGSSYGEREVTVEVMHAYGGSARRVRPKSKPQRIGAADFAGVFPVRLAAGESAVQSAVRHWISYVHDSPRSGLSRHAERELYADEYVARFSIGRVNPAQLAAVRLPVPSHSDPVSLVATCLADSLKQQRSIAQVDRPWPWCLLDSLDVLRRAESYTPDQVTAFVQDDPAGKLLLALGFVTWVQAEEEMVSTYESESSTSAGAQPTLWKYEFKSRQEVEWFEAGVAIGKSLARSAPEIAEAVAARFPDAGEAYVEPGGDALLLAQGSVAVAALLQRNVYYLGPLREEPHPVNRRSLVPGSSALGTKGEYTAAVLVEHQERRIEAPCPPDADLPQESMSLTDAVRMWLRHFDIADDIKVDETSLGPVLQVREKSQGRWLHLTHVGVGVSQLLPVVVLCLLADEGSVVMLEQPELHLHPKLQQQLGDFLLACARTGRQLIVETHSEYIVSRLRFRIADAPDDSMLPLVGIVFAEKNFKGDTHFRTVHANAYGGIEEWPKDFFDQSTNEAQDILRAAIRKRRAETDRADQVE